MFFSSFNRPTFINKHRLTQKTSFLGQTFDIKVEMFGCYKNSKMETVLKDANFMSVCVFVYKCRRLREQMCQNRIKFLYGFLQTNKRFCYINDVTKFWTNPPHRHALALAKSLTSSPLGSNVKRLLEVSKPNTLHKLIQSNSS